MLQKSVPEFSQNLSRSYSCFSIFLSKFNVDIWSKRMWCPLTMLSVIMLQDCPNGKLTPNTFCEMYKMFFPAGDADKFCENVFRTFDADKSGTIDFKVGKLLLKEDSATSVSEVLLRFLQEFLMAIDVTSAGTPREKLLWAFRFLFSNHQFLSFGFFKYRDWGSSWHSL